MADRERRRGGPPGVAGRYPGRREPARGFTLVELVIVTAIVGILASAALPLARWSVKRGKEHELQANLRILRTAIDRYHDAAVAGLIEVEEGGSGYPPSLDVLVEGVPLIAPIPVPVPAVIDEYAATGAGLTGGLAALAERAQGAGLPGAPGSRGGGLDDQGSGGFGTGTPSLGSVGALGTGMQRPTSLFGNRRGTAFGQATLSSGRLPGLGRVQLEAEAREGAPMATGIGGGSRGQGAAGNQVGTSLLGRAPRLLGGASADVQQPIVGPDGEAVKLILLRRLPVDPFTGKDDWGLRCYGEPPDDRLWCGKDVLDVYSKSPAKSIGGTNYRDW